MWVEETKNGKYKYVERYEDFLTGETKRVSVVMDKNTAQTRKLAQKTLDEKINATLAKSSNPEKAYTLKDIATAYLEEQAITVKKSTYRRNSFTCASLLKILGENTIANRITSRYVVNALLKTQKTAAQMNELIKRFKGLMHWGYMHDMVESILFLDKIERFPDTPHRLKIQDKFLEKEELHSLLQGMNMELWKMVTEFLALSGIRFGEMAALTTNDIDLNNRSIHISKTYDANNEVTTTAKTASSERDVFMQDELFTVCKKLNSYMLRQKIMYSYGPSELFLRDKTGEHIKYYAYNKYLQENALKTLGRKITPHVLRHTHASLLMENGVDIDTISRRLGHEDSQITKEIYLHLTERLKEKDRERISGIKIM